MSGWVAFRRMADTPATAGGMRVPGRWATLLVASLAVFVVTLNLSSLIAALPEVHQAFGLSPTGLQWVVNTYSLVYGGLLLLGGRASDIWCIKRTFIYGLAIFTLATLLCGLAGSGAMLIAGRGLQGVGAALVTPASLAMVNAAYTEPRGRLRAIGTWSAALAGGGGFGLFIGGAIAEHTTWRWVFLATVPATLIVWAIARWSLAPNPVRLKWSELDLPGSFAIVVATVGLVLGVVESESSGWTAPISWVSLLVAAAAFAVFLIIEARLAPRPLVPLAIFRQRSIWVGNVVMFVLPGVMLTTWFLIALFLEQGWGYSATQAGLALVPNAAVLVLGSQVSGRIAPRVGARVLVVGGLVIYAAGALWLSTISATGSYVADILGPTILIGLGFALALPAVAAGATLGVAPSDIGLVAGLVNATRQIGTSVGFGVLFTVALAGGTMAMTGDDVAAAFAVAIHRAFIVSTVILVAAAAVGLLAPSGTGRR